MSAVANAVPSSSRTVPESSIDELDANICRLASRIHSFTYQMLVLVREFDDRMGWAKWSFPSCAEWLSWRCGISLATAREKVRTAQALRQLPEISLAFSEGKLSYTKARELSRVAAIYGEDSLLRYALDATAPQVAERCRQIRNTHPDSVRDALRGWQARSLSAYRDEARRTLALRVELPLETGELVMQAIQRALENEQIADGAAEKSISSFQSQQADALVAIVKTYLAGGIAEAGAESSSPADRYEVVVHVDEAALRGQTGRADAPLETVKRLACDTSIVVVTEDQRGTPLNVGRKHRIVPARIRRAIWARDRHCTFPGCHRTRFVEAHHVHHWIDGGETSADNLVLLCSFHHRLLHEGGYRIGHDYRGEHYFVRADGRAIPRCGYREDDYSDDVENPPMGGLDFPDIEADRSSMQVREPRAVYRLAVA